MGSRVGWSRSLAAGLTECRLAGKPRAHVERGSSGVGDRMRPEATIAQLPHGVISSLGCRDADAASLVIVEPTGRRSRHRPSVLACSRMTWLSPASDRPAWLRFRAHTRGCLDRFPVERTGEFLDLQRVKATGPLPRSGHNVLAGSITPTALGCRPLRFARQWERIEARATTGDRRTTASSFRFRAPLPTP